MKAQRPSTARVEPSPKPDKRQRDSSIDEFEKLEQACGKPNENRTYK